VRKIAPILAICYGSKHSEPLASGSFLKGVEMAKFFMDYRQEGELYPDQNGIEFRDVEEAYAQAFRSAQDMWSELLRARQDPRRCSFEIRDSGRELLFLLPFIEVMESCRRDSTAPDITDTYRSACATRDHARRAAMEFNEVLRALQGSLKQSRALLVCEI